jgi:NADPH-dependent curcumin reductase CurA
MRAFAVGRVEASHQSDFRSGDFAAGMFGWQDYVAVEVKVIQRKITETDLPISTSLGVLGLNGPTAYFGLQEIGQPKTGETAASIANWEPMPVGTRVERHLLVKRARMQGFLI